ncbi:hypothetical protein [Streptomyces sp. 1222.5]|uniref:hypothetical protein n=1 Tax=Streptomyces sp. 1222.5 TaxID=1881026 RepID=UPI003D726356
MTLNLTFAALARLTVHRIQNRWRDLLAILHGYCNDRPIKLNIPGESGGYLHWRCALKRGHDGKHRSRNAVWNDSGKVSHEPIQRPTGQPWERACTPTIRQARNLRRWHEAPVSRRTR